jgi:hypothetical protein
MSLFSTAAQTGPQMGSDRLGTRPLLGLPVFLFGIGIVERLGQEVIGGCADPLIQVWALAWWPHALANSLNPFISRILWPSGYNLTRTTSVPEPGLVFHPVTRLFGPLI